MKIEVTDEFIIGGTIALIVWIICHTIVAFHT